MLDTERMFRRKQVSESERAAQLEDALRGLGPDRARAEALLARMTPKERRETERVLVRSGPKHWARIEKIMLRFGDLAPAGADEGSEPAAQPPARPGAPSSAPSSDEQRAAVNRALGR